MKAEKLLKKIGDIDERYVAAAESRGRKTVKRSFTKWAALAACFVLACAVAIPAINGGRQKGAMDMNGAAPPQSTGTKVAEAPKTEDKAAMESEPSAEPEPQAVANSPAGSPADSDNAESPAAEGYETTRSVIIQGYLEDGDTQTDYCYAIPKTGQVVISEYLRMAIEKYEKEENTEFTYRVVVDFFRGDKQIFPLSADAETEMQRLYDLGYTVAIEEAQKDDMVFTWFTIHASADQILNFEPDPEYGYMLFLYNERVPGEEELTPEVVQQTNRPVN
ncbi:MAG: hypothetical protein II689_00020 [Firmicutes bacterium]|nr:hypothetical protein [Bacillota bacterium]